MAGKGKSSNKQAQAQPLGHMDPKRCSGFPNLFLQQCLKETLIKSRAW